MAALIIIVNENSQCAYTEFLYIWDNEPTFSDVQITKINALVLSSEWTPVREADMLRSFGHKVIIFHGQCEESDHA